MKFKLKVNTYKSPVAAALWSIAFPGLGHLYVREYIIGFLLLFMELIVNFLSNINLSIFYAFTGQLEKSLTVMDFRWALFYPSIYAFSIWDAYNRAITINYQLSENLIVPPHKIAHLTGLFFGLMVGFNLGLQWNIFTSPIFSTLFGGFIGAIIGLFIEKIIHCKKT